MPHNLKKYGLGEPFREFPGGSWNDIARFVEANRGNGEPPHRPEEFDAPQDPRGPVKCWVKNTTGGQVPAGGVMKLGEVFVDPDDDAAAVLEGLQFEGHAPESNNATQHVAFMADATDDGDVGSGVIPGAAWVRVNVTSAAHRCARVIGSGDALESSSGAGYPIIWKKENSTGEQWVVIALHGRRSKIFAAVNQVGGVTPAMATFNFTGATAIQGQAPIGGNGTAQNHLAQSFDNGQLVNLDEGDDGEWYTDTVNEPGEGGGGDSSLVVTFRLIEDMAYADTAKQAKPVDATGAVDAAASAFYVVDVEHRFYGKAPAGADDGYLGTAVKFTENYNSTGVPGYRIIEMEGPAQWLVAVTNAAFSMGSPSGVTLTVDEIFGRPFRGRRLPASGSINVYDDLSVASSHQSGEKWLIAWDEAEAHYIFVVPLEPPGGDLEVAMVTGTIPALTAIDGTLFTATLGSGSARWVQVSGGSVTDRTTTLTAYNLTMTAVVGSTGTPVLVMGKKVGTNFYIIPFDMRGMPGYIKGTRQAPYHAANTDTFTLDGEDCP